MSGPFSANTEIDLTTGVSVPAAFVVQGSSVRIKLKATTCNGKVINLSDLDQIKVEAKKRFTSVPDPIFSASLVNGKVVVIDATTGRYDVVLEPADTNFIGDANLQSMYLFDDGRLFINDICLLLFKPSFVVPD